MKHYKIKNTKTGLFSTGGSLPNWSKNGKVWRTLGQVRSHLTLFLSCNDKKKTNDWEIIEYEMIEVQSRKIQDCRS